MIRDLDYLAAGRLIEARIAEVTDIKRVQPLGNLYALLENEPDEFLKRVKGKLPAAYVGFDGEQIGDMTADGLAHAAIQRWLVVLVVGNYRAADTLEGVTDEAGPLLGQLLVALSGWQPAAGFLNLQRQAAPRPGYLAGVGFFPLVFSTAIFVEGLNEDN